MAKENKINALVESKIDPNALPKSLAEVRFIATMIEKAGMLSYNESIETAIIKIKKGMELEIPPMMAMEQLYVMNGKSAMQGEGMLALIFSRCPTAEIQYKKMTAEESIIKARRNRQDEFTEFSYTIQEASKIEVYNKKTKQKSKLVDKDNWKNYPKNMLTWRNVANMGRFLFADIIQGMYLPDEIEDIPFKPAEVPKKLETIKIDSTDEAIDAVFEEYEQEQEQKKEKAQERSRSLKEWTELYAKEVPKNKRSEIKFEEWKKQYEENQDSDLRKQYEEHKKKFNSPMSFEEWRARELTMKEEEKNGLQK